MGRHGFKPINTDYLNLSIYALRKLGVFDNTHSKQIVCWGEGEDRAKISIFYRIGEHDRQCLEFNYKIRQAGEENYTPVNYKIDIERTNCYFGGQRLWFRCPKCYRRSAVLYSPGSRFVCRKCANCCYQSQNINKRNRWAIATSCFDAGEKAEKLYENKRWQTQYAGQFTKRYRRYCNYLNTSERLGLTWLQLEKI